MINIILLSFFSSHLCVLEAANALWWIRSPPGAITVHFVPC